MTVHQPTHPPDRLAVFQLSHLINFSFIQFYFSSSLIKKSAAIVLLNNTVVSGTLLAAERNRYVSVHLI